MSISKTHFSHVRELKLRQYINASSGDLKALRRARNGNKEQDLDAWLSVINSYLQEFGMSEEYKEIHDKMLELAELNHEYLTDLYEHLVMLKESAGYLWNDRSLVFDVKINNPKRRLLNDINQLKEELRKLSEQGGDTPDILDEISDLRIAQIDVDVDNFTVYEYKKLIERLNIKNKQAAHG